MPDKGQNSLPSYSPPPFLFKVLFGFRKQTLKKGGFNGCSFLGGGGSLREPEVHGNFRTQCSRDAQNC